MKQISQGNVIKNCYSKINSIQLKFYINIVLKYIIIHIKWSLKDIWIFRMWCFVTSLTCALSVITQPVFKLQLKLTDSLRLRCQVSLTVCLSLFLYSLLEMAWMCKACTSGLLVYCLFSAMCFSDKLHFNQVARLPWMALRYPLHFCLILLIIFSQKQLFLGLYHYKFKKHDTINCIQKEMCRETEQHTEKLSV